MLLIRFCLFRKKYLSKQKALDDDPRVIQKTIFTGKASKNTAIYYILEQYRETILKFSKGTTNVL